MYIATMVVTGAAASHSTADTYTERILHVRRNLSLSWRAFAQSVGDECASIRTSSGEMPAVCGQPFSALRLRVMRSQLRRTSRAGESMATYLHRLRTEYHLVHAALNSFVLDIRETPEFIEQGFSNIRDPWDTLIVELDQIMDEYAQRVNLNQLVFPEEPDRASQINCFIWAIFVVVVFMAPLTVIRGMRP